MLNIGELEVCTMTFYAHKSDDGRLQSVKEHLEGTASISRNNAVEFIKPLAYAAGLAHDIGKYSVDFQRRLNGESIRYEHSSCGAIEYNKLNYNKLPKLMLEYCIAGHHTGLPDGGAKNDSIEDTTLSARLNRTEKYTGNSDYSYYHKEINLEMPDFSEIENILKEEKNPISMLEKYAFFIRYLFSCLTDADFIDTEKFCNPSVERSLFSDFTAAYKQLEKQFGCFIHETELQKARSRLQKQVYSNDKKCEISILNLPTGSGKTLCSLKLALNKLLNDKSKKRIIYVIPYTSVIEQTAEIFRNLIGDCADILEHHSNYCFDDDGKEISTAEKLKKSSENWDAPIVVTTNVQFFESMYHYKTSSLRKLHNMADSIIVFDEIHLLPIEMLQPCLRGIGYITMYLNSEAILLSATMPDYSKFFDEYMPKCTVNHLVTDYSDFEYFKKCNYKFMNLTDIDNLVMKAAEYENSLIVVNKRKTAREIYNFICGKKYHLSTYMTPADRSSAISKIRADLLNGENITVVSTSLIEVGVDLDFKAVFREINGLDNILQSGGRCNREGKMASGDVCIFEMEKNTSDYKANIVKGLLNEFNDISSKECIEEYYSRVFKAKENVIKNNTISNGSICGLTKVGPENLPFRSYADSFKFIRESTIGIVICNCDDAENLYKKLIYGNYSVKRKLQKYTVSLKRYEFEDALKLGIVDDSGTGVYQLTNSSYYNENTGLCLDFTNDIIF